MNITEAEKKIEDAEAKLSFLQFQKHQRRVQLMREFEAEELKDPNFQAAQKAVMDTKKALEDLKNKVLEDLQNTEQQTKSNDV